MYEVRIRSDEFCIRRVDHLSARPELILIKIRLSKMYDLSVRLEQLGSSWIVSPQDRMRAHTPSGIYHMLLLGIPPPWVR